MAFKRLNLTRGDTQSFTLTFKDGNSNPYCIKDWTVFFTLKTNHNLPDSLASLQKTVTLFSDTTGGTSGVAVIQVDADDTINLEPAEYDYDIAVCTNLGEQYTVMKGKLDLEYDVTNRGTAGT
jgi:hypothetical protein